MEIPQEPRTETVVRQYGADGALTPEPGCYP